MVQIEDEFGQFFTESSVSENVHVGVFNNVDLMGSQDIAEPLIF